MRKQEILHFIVARGYDDDGYIYANDPNNRTVPRKQKQDKFKSCMKQAFIFWPEQITYTPEPEVLVEKAPGREPVIIDISKWQGNIDFKALKQGVDLVIARVSCGSDKDVKFDEYAKSMNEYQIPFGVYCYSYAGTDAKAKDEAQKIVSYAKAYNPLFYVMDAEESKINTSAIKTFVQELRSFGIKKAGCYVAHNHYKDYKYDTINNLFDFDWIPRYGKNDGTIEGSTKPDYPCNLWQYTSNGKVNGINGRVDMNIILGDELDLAWFLSR